MPTARIITRNRESALPLAQKLQACGYTTHIVSPEDTRDFDPDLEIDLDNYAQGAEGALLTDEEMVRFAEHHSAPEAGGITANASWEDEYQDYVVEREFVLAPMWRSFRARVEAIWKTMRPEPRQLPAPIMENAPVARQHAEVSEQSYVAPTPQGEVESVEAVAQQEQAVAALPQVEPLSPLFAEAETEAIAATQVEPEPVAEEIALTISAEQEAPAELPAISEPVMAAELEALSDPPAISEPVIAPAARSEAPAAAPEEHITFQPPSQPPQEPIVVSAALRLESLIEASREKATEFSIWLKDIDWSWLSLLRDEMTAAGRKGVTTALTTASKGSELAFIAAKKGFAETKKQAAKISMPTMPAMPDMSEVRERLRLDRSRDRMLAYSFVFGAVLAGMFLLGWMAAFHLKPRAVQSAAPPSEMQPAQPTTPTVPVVPAAAVVVPPQPSQPSKEPLALTESDESAAPAVQKTRKSHQSSMTADDDTADDVVVRHFDAKPKPKSEGNTASVKHYSDLNDQ